MKSYMYILHDNSNKTNITKLYSRNHIIQDGIHLEHVEQLFLKPFSKF